MMRYSCIGKSLELAVEQYVALALQELFGSVFVGAVTITYPPSRVACITFIPAIICVIMHCPDEHNEMLADSQMETELFVEECIGMALERWLDHVLLDMVTVSYIPCEDKQYLDTRKGLRK